MERGRPDLTASSPTEPGILHDGDEAVPAPAEGITHKPLFGGNKLLKFGRLTEEDKSLVGSRLGQNFIFLRVTIRAF